MVHELHLAVDGKPVCVNIPQTHEDAYHQTAVVEILVLLYFLDYDNAPIGRSDYNLLCILAVEIADRTAIEINDNTINGVKDGEENPKWDFRVEYVP